VVLLSVGLNASWATLDPLPIGVPGTVPLFQRAVGEPVSVSQLNCANIILPTSNIVGSNANNNSSNNSNSNNTNDETSAYFRELVLQVARPRALVEGLSKRRKTSAIAEEGGEGEASIIGNSIIDNGSKLGAFSIEAAVMLPKSSSGSSRSADEGFASNGKEPSSLEPSTLFLTITNAYEGAICMDIAPNMKQVAVGHRDSAVRVWRTSGDAASHFGRLLPKDSANHCAQRAEETGNAVAGWLVDEVLPKTRRMTAADIARKSSFVNASASINGASSSSSSRSGMTCLELRGHSRAVYGVSQDHSAVDRGGHAENRLVLSSSADETIRLWDTAVMQCVGVYTGVCPSWAVQFSPLGYHFASANQDKTGTVYATDRVTPLRLLQGHVSDVNAVTWHANGMLLATGSDDKTARLWDVRAGRSARLLRGCSAPICTVAISPLGNILAAGTENGRIYLWDLATSRSLAILHGHDGAVHSVAFNPDSTALCSGGGDCSVRVWDMSEVHKIVRPKGTESFAGAGASSSNSSSSSSGSTGIGAKIVGNPDSSHIVLRPHSTYFTKYSPVFAVGYHSAGLLYAGGPFSLTDAVATTNGSTGAENGTQQSGSNEEAMVTATEQDTVAALGISRAMFSYH
jgi:WD40 repeat protein